MIPFTAHPRRSLIFMPGNRPTLFPKALESGADIVCVDLEDAIAPQDKEEARANTFPLFADHDTGQGPECMVRINCLRTAEGLADLLALLECDQCPPALMLTKTKSADEIRVYEELLAGAGHAPRLHVIVETNQALEACHEIAHASDTLDSLLFGGVDMAAELRVEPSWEGLRYARARVVHAAASANIDVIDVPFMDLADMDGLAAEAQAVRGLGFTGKAAIHPKQIPLINRAFSPNDEEIAFARRAIAAFVEQGSGVVVVDNKLIEKPVLRSMARILAIAERLAGEDEA